MTLNIGRSFIYMFQDERWIMKIVIGGVLVFIPIVNFIVLGYVLAVFKRVADGTDVPLPEWDDFGGMFIAGLTLFVIGLIYEIPVMLFSFLHSGLHVVELLGVSGAGHGYNVMNIVRLLDYCTSCSSVVWAILVVLVVPAALIRYAVTGHFVSAFQFGDIFSFISGNIANYVVALILAWVTIFVAYLGLVGLCVGVVFTMFWYYLVVAHLLGQVQRESLAVT